VSLTEEANNMASHEFDETPHHEYTTSSNSSKGAVIGLTVGLVLALALTPTAVPTAIGCTATTIVAG